MGLNHRISELERRVARLEHSFDAPGENDRQPVDEHGDSQHESKTAPGETVISLTPKYSKQPQGRSYASTPRWKNIPRRFPWWRTLEAAGIVAVVWYAFVSHLQWRDLRHNFEVDQRAWIKVQAVIPTDTPTGAQPKVEFVNTGKSPALKVEVDAMFDIIGNDKAPIFVFTPHHFMAFADAVFPNAKHDFVVAPTPANNDGTGRNLSPSELHSMQDGKSYIAIWGLASYIDQFGPHWTKFCGWAPFSTQPSTFKALDCAHYNAVGDGVLPTPPRN